MRIAIQLIVVAALVAGGYLAWVNRAELPLVGSYFAPPAEGRRGGGAVPVDAETLKPRELTDTVRVVGTARANQSVTITSEIAGRIAELNVSEGRQVEKGAVLVQFGTAEIAAELERARAQLNLAQQVYERGETTRRKGLITEARTEELAQGLAAAEAEVRAIQARIGKFTLRAPFSGRLGLKQASVGALVQPGEPIVTLDDISVIKLDFDVPETALAALHPGQVVLARASAYPDVPVEGVVSTIDTRIDPETRAVTVRAEIDNAEGLLRPGMFLTVEVVYARTANALMVPEEAVLVVDGGAYVFAIVDGKAERRAVELGRRRPGFVEVLDGLSPGETVITAGVQKVRPGAPVNLRNPVTAAAEG